MHAIIQADNLGNIVFLNSFAEKMTGWMATEAVGRSINKVFSVIDSISAENMLSKGILVNRYGREFMIEYSYTSWPHNQGTLLVFQEISDKMTLLEQNDFLKKYDSLTKLPNKDFFLGFFKERIDEDRQQGDKIIALLIIGIDRFRFINDTMGLKTGDLLLVEIAQRLQKIFGLNQVFRYGGDEFVVVIDDCKDKFGVLSLAGDIVHSFSGRLDLGEFEVFCSLSIGISLFPEHGTEVDELIQMADIALYAAAQKGGNRHHLYDSEDTKPFKLFSKIGMLKNALKNNEFILHYQPQINLSDGHITSVEALIRWNSPIGKIMPNDFIALAEETGMIIPIGEWVIREACRQCKRWHDEGFSSLQISVNISAKQFYEPDFVSSVLSILKECELEPKYFIIEITESIAMKNHETTSNTIREFNRTGVKVSIDDFGTGYSCLNYLANLQINALKIDKSFVDNLHQQNKKKKVTNAIIKLAQSLDLEVVAEGIELEEQLSYLINQKCHKAQGYLISHPLPPEEVTRFFQKNK